MCIVAKADGSPRFCVDYRTTINKFLVRETCPMPDIESHIDAIGGAKFITVCDVQSAYWQIPMANMDCHKTAFVTSKGKYVFKVPPFGIASAPWVFERAMSLAFANFWPTEWLVGIYGRYHRVSCNVANLPRIIRGCVSSTSRSRAVIETIQNSFWTEESPLSWVCIIH